MRTSVATLVLGISLPLVTSFSFPGVLPGSALRRDVNVMGAVGRALPRTAARCNAARSMVMADDAAPATVQEPFVAAGMTVENFWERCVGTWTGLRSSHSIAFGQIGEWRRDIFSVCGTLATSERSDVVVLHLRYWPSSPAVLVLDWTAARQVVERDRFSALLALWLQDS